MILSAEFGAAEADPKLRFGHHAEQSGFGELSLPKREDGAPGTLMHFSPMKFREPLHLLGKKLAHFG